jgi:hypothetical protein
MYVYFDKTSNMVLSTSERKLTSLSNDSNIGYIVLPDYTQKSKELMTVSKQNLSIVNNNVYLFGAPLFVFSEVKPFYIGLLKEKATDSTDKFIELCFDYLETLVESEREGVTITYPVPAIDPSTGNTVNLANSSELAALYKSTLSLRLTDLSTSLSKFSKVKRDISSATNVSQLTTLDMGL